MDCGIFLPTWTQTFFHKFLRQGSSEYTYSFWWISLAENIVKCVTPIGPCVNLQCPDGHVCQLKDNLCYPIKKAASKGKPTDWMQNCTIKLFILTSKCTTQFILIIHNLHPWDPATLNSNQGFLLLHSKRRSASGCTKGKLLTRFPCSWAISAVYEHRESSIVALINGDGLQLQATSHSNYCLIHSKGAHSPQRIVRVSRLAKRPRELSAHRRRCFSSRDILPPRQPMKQFIHTFIHTNVLRSFSNSERIRMVVHISSHEEISVVFFKHFVTQAAPCDCVFNHVS